MAALRSWKIAYLVVVTLARKYTKALFLGFLIGLSLSLIFWRTYPFISQQMLVPVDRIGIVGSFTPNTLPLFIQNKISFGLTTLADDGSALPGLAKSWVATDSGRVFTFYLRDDVVWHDGKQVIANDVNYNIKNVSFSVLGTHIIRATLKNAYSPFPVILSKPLFQAGLNGFGSYKVANIKLDGDSVSYLKLVPAVSTNKSLRAEEYRFYQTETMAVTAYKLGEINVINDLSSPYDLHSWGKTKVEESTKYNRIVTLFFNMSNETLSDKSIRQALAFAVPVVPGEHANSPIAKTSWAYTKEKVKQYSTDLSQAKKLSGDIITASESAKLTITTFPQYVDVAQSIAANWNKVGLTTNVKVVNVIPQAYDVLLTAQELPPDPDQYPFWHSTQTQTNITGYANVKIDKLLEDGRQELNTEKRKAIYADFQRRLVDDAPAVFLYYAKSYTIRRL
jgi:peptide/nickel transport system substrate-binding protein